MMKHSMIKAVVTILLVLIVGTLSTPPLSADSTAYLSSKFLPSPNYTQNDISALLRIEGDAFGVPKNDVDFLTPQGTRTSCRLIGGSGCTIHNEYGTTGVLIASTWEFFIAGQQRPSGTYTAVVKLCSVTIYPNLCGGYTEKVRIPFYIEDALVTYTIAGNAGVAGATLTYVDGTLKTAAGDGTGAYAIRVPSGWSGTVRPSKTDYFFSPASRTYTNVLTDQTGQDYTAIPITGRNYLPLVIR